ncbi:hypothetical protein C8R43DRAFT_899590 [Mycena crocata]|nr:hypothetical protein C8R43DRAFT_899590 [Mycena crocata]
MSFLAQSFVPSKLGDDSQPFTDPAGLSMIIGGSAMYLKPGERWPECATCKHPLVPFVQMNASSNFTPEEFRSVIPSVVAAEGALATMVQLFVCTVYDCYDTSVGYSTATRSWLVRIATVPFDTEDTADRLAAREKIEETTGFLPARIIKTWDAGKQETIHEERSFDEDESEEFYEEHKPEGGLKLLGHSVRGTHRSIRPGVSDPHWHPGKYECSDDNCSGGGPHNEFPVRRQLIQLGDYHCQWDMATRGNVWIEQCITHPEVLNLSMSGNW